MTLFLDGVLANTQSVPQFDGAVASSGDNLTVVSGEGDGENVLNRKIITYKLQVIEYESRLLNSISIYLGVANESSSGVTRGKIPKSEGTVP